MLSHRSRRRPRVSDCKRDLAPRGHDRLNRRDAHHHGVAHDVVHLVALENRLGERYRDARLPCRLASLGQTHQRGVLARALDDRVEFGCRAR